MNQRVMIAESDEDLAGLLVEQLRWTRPELEVCRSTNADGLFEQMRQQLPDLLIVDLRLPGLNEAGLLPNVRNLAARLPVIVMAADCKPDERRLALRYGVSGWLEKPFKPEELLSTLAWALRDEVRAPDWRERLAESAFALRAVESAMSAATLEDTEDGHPFCLTQTPLQQQVAETSTFSVVAPGAPDWDDAEVAIIPLAEPLAGVTTGLRRTYGIPLRELAMAADTATIEVVSLRPQRVQLAPPLPGTQPDKEIVSPAWMANLLQGDQFLEAPSLRADLMQPGEVGQNWIYQAGKYCLKTSRHFCFDDPAAAHAYLETYLQKHAALGELYPDHTFFVLTPDPQGQFWLWTIAPWLVTLEMELADAVQQRDEVALATALCKFAEAVQRSLQLALQKQLLLNVQPSKFASLYAGGPLVYVADEIGQGGRLPNIGAAIFSCAATYAAWPQALHVYLDVLGVGLSHRFNGEQVRQLDLLRAVSEVPLQAGALREAQTQLIERIQSCLG